MGTIKRIIKKWILSEKEWARLNNFEKYLPKKYGESRSVSYSIKNTSEEVFTTTTGWVNGEGFDISSEMINDKGVSYSKHVFSLSNDEVRCLLECLNDHKFFEIEEDDNL